MFEGVQHTHGIYLGMSHLDCGSASWQEAKYLRKGLGAITYQVQAF